jgi:hypothetical protein
MRKMLTVVSIAALAACNNAGTETATNASTVAKPAAAVTYAYPINYSSQFEMGDPKKGQVVAELWKEFDNNNLKNQAGLFADSVTMHFDGSEMVGTRDMMLSETQKWRDQMSSVKSQIDAIMTTKATDKDKDGNWVCVWGSEITTDKTGKIDSSRLQEIWHFNKDSKIDYMSQFRQAYPKAKK